MTSADVQISIPPKPEFVGLARHVVGATARMGGLSPASVDNAKLAASEAATNAVTVTARAGSNEAVEVSAELEGDRVHVVVGHRVAEVEARGDDLRSLDESDDQDPDSLDFSFERGLSLPLIQGLVDELEVSPRDDGGTSIRMTIIDVEDGTPES